jgi:phospholipid transport system substrate-binding protein
MSRIAVGPDWAKLTPEQQQRVRDAFARYTIATYANRFDDYGGEAFEVDPAPVASPNGSVVQSRIVKSNGEKVSLDYLMRQGADGGWKIIDVYLSGTVSELASRRSEFAAVLQREGADGLIRLLEQRAVPGRAG